MHLPDGTAAPPASTPVTPAVVVVASSLGGIQALRTILSGLPADLAVPVLVAQHLESGRRSRLAEVLAAVSALPVAEAAGGERLEPGKVFVAPPDRHMVVGADGCLALSDAPPVRFSRPSADPLFFSVAEHFGAAVVAVVLTGCDGDGSAGVRAVKARGGTVLVQDPATAQKESMPRNAIDTGTVDEIVPLERIAARIARAASPSE